MHAHTYTCMHVCSHTHGHSTTRSSLTTVRTSDAHRDFQYTQANIHTLTHACMYTRTHTHACMHVHTHTHTHACTHTHTRACMHLHTHTHTHACMHTHTHLHTTLHPPTHTEALHYRKHPHHCHSAFHFRLRQGPLMIWWSLPSTPGHLLLLLLPLG